MNYFKDRYKDFRTWLKQRVCRHKCFHAYEEVRTTGMDGHPNWTALFSCSECGEVLSVVAGYHGDPELIREALEGESPPVVSGRSSDTRFLTGREARLQARKMEVTREWQEKGFLPVSEGEVVAEAERRLDAEEPLRRRSE